MTNVTSWQGQLQYMLVRAVNDSLLLVLFVDTFLHYFTSPPPLHKINMLTLPRTSWFSFQAFTVIAKWLRYSVFRIVFKNKNWLGGGRLTRGWLPARLADRSKGAYEKKKKNNNRKKKKKSCRIWQVADVNMLPRLCRMPQQLCAFPTRSLLLIMFPLRVELQLNMLNARVWKRIAKSVVQVSPPFPCRQNQIFFFFFWARWRTICSPPLKKNNNISL